VPKDKFEPVDNPETFYRDADLVDYYQREFDSLDKDDDKGRAKVQDKLIRAKRAAAMTSSVTEETE
jgi:hypothetical protein